jgi:hypothetical protein
MAAATTRVYQRSIDETFAVALKVIRDLGYKIDSIDKTNGLLRFKTGLSWKSWTGQEMSIMVTKKTAWSTEVSVAGARNRGEGLLGLLGAIQVIDWGEAKSIARTVIRRMDADLIG